MKKELTDNIFVNIKYFGVIAEKTNLEIEKTSFDFNQLSKIVESIKNKYDLHQLSFQISLNLNLVNSEDSIIVNDGDEIAFLPPFAGG
ncbi:MAG: molybdopterin synthase sulfur carrier subunit [Flavobacteriaceae bacterium]|nr:molybdopterin synthase sulfur carrier subunit [Flavobacteriaceae bacterium]|tara:strand:- start:210 stop:473 length:264 start_codon:yes stop_codon:yes gene_type:complete